MKEFIVEWTRAICVEAKNEDDARTKGLALLKEKYGSEELTVVKS